MAVRALDLVLTSECNLRCAYCYQNAKAPGTMQWPTLQRGLDLLLGSTYDDVRVHFVGGEPLLAFDLIERAVGHIESSHPTALRVSHTITTNGLLLGARQRRLLDAHGFRVRLSFDGVPRMQQLRGPGTFEQLDDLLDVLAAEHPALFSERLSVLVTIVPETVRHLAETFRYLISKGVRDLSIEPAIGGRGRWTHQMHRALAEQLAAVFDASLAHYRATGLVPWRRLRRHGQRRSPEVGDWYCGVGTGQSLAVDVDGSVSGCVMFAHSYQRFPQTPLGAGLAGLVIGRIDDPDLPQRICNYMTAVQGTGVFHNRGRKRSSFRRCTSCRCRADCVVCPCAIVHGSDDGDPDRIPDFICAFNRIVSRQSRVFPPTDNGPTWEDEYQRVLEQARTVVARERARIAGATTPVTGSR
jgi:sulfatase maturation enzyme AslB (radical SAM superfamily)